MKSAFLTTRQAAQRLSAQSGQLVLEWQVRRLFEDGNLPEPPRFGGKRLVSVRHLRAIRDALVSRGWLGLSEDGT